MGDVTMGKAPPPEAKDAPWVEKFRPRSLEDVAAHKEIVDTIRKLLAANRLPHLLFYGPPGTGKTSTILAIANELYGKSRGHMVLELNASDDRGIDVVRKEIQDFASSRFMFSEKFKLVILDECDAMTKDAQMALRRIIEKYTRNTRFCLICNYVSKIIPALQSRCTRFRFCPLDQSFVRERVAHVAQQEGVTVTDDGVGALVKLGGGDMRKTLNIMQSSYMSAGEVSEAAVYGCTGNPLPQDIETVVHWLFNEPLGVAYERILELQVQKGLALLDVLGELQEWVMRIQMPTPVRINLLDALADIEHRLAYGTSERLQLGALAAAFTAAKEGIVLAVQ